MPRGSRRRSASSRTSLPTQTADIYRDTYYIEKTTNTHADVLAVNGLAFIIHRIAEPHGIQVWVEDHDNHFAVRCSQPLTRDIVQKTSFFMPARIVLKQKSGSLVAKGAPKAANLQELAQQSSLAVVYDEARRQAAEYLQWREQMRAQSSNQPPPVAPPPDYDFLRAVAGNPVSVNNKLLYIWQSAQKSGFATLLETILTFAASLPNDPDAAQRFLRANDPSLASTQEVTALQLFNPASGKGPAAIKAVSTSDVNLKSFWLLEMLKLIGLRWGGFARFVEKDQVVYALHPRKLDWSLHLEVLERFQRCLPGRLGSLKLDILASLLYTQALLRYAVETNDQGLLAALFGAEHGVSDLVLGFETAYYKSLGQSSATMNIAHLGLPAWVRPKHRGDLPIYEQALEGHIRIARALNEDRSDEYGLLRRLREFISSSNVYHLLNFTDGYANVVIQRDRLYPQFTTRTLEVVMTTLEPKFSEIVQSKGFRNIAYAIRMATVEAHRRALNRNRDRYQVHYEVRYGLGQDLLRKAAVCNEFIAALSEFIHAYNNENARMRERMERQTGNPRPKGTRSDVSTHDLEELLGLIDRFGDCQLIASLLVAYGYASPFQRDESRQAQPEDEADLDVESPELEEAVEGTDEEE